MVWVSAARILIASALLAASACQPNDSARGALAPGQPFPELTLRSLSGEARPLASFGERVKIINFWATWCGPCRAEMPSLQWLSDRLDPTQAVVIGVSVDTDLNLVKEFNLAYGIGFADYTLQDTGAGSGEPLRLAVLPQTYILSADGTVAMLKLGAYRWDSEQVVALIDQLYQKQAVNTVKETLDD